jgi:predicted metal-dependent peptidase
LSAQESKLLACRENAVMNNPLLVSLALGIKLVPIQGQCCRTMCTDGRRLFYDVDFMAKQSLPQANFGYLHELIHCLLGHVPRVKNLLKDYADEAGGEKRCMSIAQVAADHVTNLLIRDMSLVTFKRRQGVRDSMIGVDDPVGAKIWADRNYKDWSLEEVFLDLLRNGFEPDDPDPECFGEVEIGDLDPSEVMDWDEVRATGRRLAASMGRMPASLIRQLDPVKARCKWRHHLRDFLVEGGRPKLNWKASDRRSQGGVFIPEHTRGKAMDGVFAFDTSGSISQRQLSRMLGHMLDCLNEASWRKLVTYSCDAAVQTRQEFRRGQKVAVEFKGGGGTSFRPVIEDIARRKEVCRFLVYFTDGEGTFPRDAPPFPVLWIHFGSRTTKYPKWAKVIRLKEQDLL